MAGDWIKLEVSTPDKPEVIRVARLLKVDKNHALGLLLKTWIWFDRNSVDGVVDGMSSQDVDDLVGKPGLCIAMQAVGWMKFDDTNRRISVPNFCRHNGESAKKRALKSERQARWRSRLRDAGVGAKSSTQPSTREEKRRNNPQRPFVFPDWLPLEAWAAFEEMRKKIRKPMTDRARELVIQELDRLRAEGHPPGAVLEQSVLNGWQSVFPLKVSVAQMRRALDT